MLIGHFNYGIAVGAVEVDEPLFCDDSCSLGFYKLYMSLLHPSVDCIFCVACNLYDLWHGQSVGIFIELTPNPFTNSSGREEGNPVLRGRGFRVLPYFAVENSAWGVTYFSGCLVESSM